jgi:hypothetical protein
MWVVLILLAIPIAGVTAIVVVPYLLLPPILRNITAGGQGDPCKPDPFWENMPADSPLRPRGSLELNARLLREFPAGSPADHLANSLSNWGFKPLPSCENDQSIRRAVFRTTFPMEMAVVVFWKIDAQNAIAWTRGYVSYTFL